MQPGRVAFPFPPIAFALRAGIVACLGLLAAESVSAATFPELYTVSVTPDPTAVDLRADATRRGMEILLTRVTGLHEAGTDPRVAELLANAARFVTSYSEVAVDEIRIGFRRSGPDGVGTALERLGLPIWGDERPSTLLWVAMEFEAGQRAEIGADTDPRAARGGPVAGRASNELPAAADDVFETVMDEILTAADERGLPVVLPRLDAEDRQYARFADVFGGFDGAIERAAERYDTDAILLGRVAVTPAGPLVLWTLRRGDIRQEFVTTIPADGIQRLADQLAAEYTVVGDARVTRISIRGVRAPGDNVRVVEYLRSLSLVEDIVVESLSAEGDLKLRLVARGGDEELRRVLTLGDVLAEPAPESTTPFVPPETGLVFVPAWRAGAP